MCGYAVVTKAIIIMLYTDFEKDSFGYGARVTRLTGIYQFSDLQLGVYKGQESVIYSSTLRHNFF